MTRTLVTGCNGYIGRHLVPALAAAGHEVAGLDRYAHRDQPEAFHLGDLNDPGVAAGAVAGADLIVHLAAAKDDWGISEAGYRRDNVDATAALLAAGRAAAVRDWVFYSTVSVYGPSDAPCDERSPHRPDHPYGATKEEAERLVATFAAEEPDARVLVVRPSVVFGPDHPDITNVSRLIEAVARGRFVMVGDGTAVKATSYIENLVAATTFLLERLAPGLHGYIVTDSPRLTTGELVAEIAARLGKPTPRWSVPLGVAAPVALVGDVAAKVTGRNLPITSARIRKFNTGTNFTAARLEGLGFRQPITMAEALDRTVAWHQARRA